MKIYIDVLIITNTIVNLVCIEAAARLTHRKLSGKRSFLSALAGSLASLLIIPTAYSYTMALVLTLIKAVSIPLTALAAFGFRSLKDFIGKTAVLALTKAVFTGVTLVLWEISDTKMIFVRNYTFYFNIPLWKLTAAVIAAYAILTAFDAVKNREAPEKRYKAVYRCGNYTLCVPAVADTGNKLTDSFTNSPVVIFCCDDLYYHYGLDTPENLYAGRFRLAAYETINGRGLIPVTSCGEVEIADDSRKFTGLRCCIGITRSGGSKAKAIFDPKILE
jgi:stage II sporulation protein GA (sporulation sigma-E factor processing peptidase)